ncbi:conserved membrane protein of unknown function [Candidatus Hydrogenisulfobacillus filiaventi]|uniref:Membrane-anchored protein n=1 Tax=Candidatus Hydrogenisulfobacillus filiaventi TaxID=2707344 RepID=A0A6F8ZFB0_9FIRM|nr:hypothetical protein [Bacillota bacterium]CAB1128350.1 conserved membrane protein of unknown function [Candidatus Hydrogenisulfobacillus filiaventi]
MPGMVPGPRRLRRWTKVPEITVWFWVAKLLTTAMGEATSDFLVHHLNPYLAVALGGVAFSAALGWQLAARRYVAAVYWTAVAMVAVFGTMVADATHVVLGVPYYASTLTFGVVLALVFRTWFRVEGTLSIHSVYTLRRELFYWAAILSTFALGTAAGDMTATTLHLGYLASGLLFAGLFALPGLAYRYLGVREVPAFWSAYVLTRPLGASFADWFGMPRSIGGLGYGHGPVSLVTTVAIVLVVGYLTVSRKDVRATAPVPGAWLPEEG